MPCDSVITNSAELSIVNKDLLHDALTALGFTDIEIKGMTLTAYDYQSGAIIEIVNGEVLGQLSEGAVREIRDRIKAECTRQVLKKAEKKFANRIKIKWTTKNKGTIRIGR